jgi:hypothetical protein
MSFPYSTALAFSEEAFSPKWGASVHEASHAVVGLLVGARVLTATITEAHAGLTHVLHRPWPSTLVALAGYEGERLLVPPELVEAWRSATDRRHARERALMFVGSCESFRAAAHFSEPSAKPPIGGDAQPKPKRTPTAEDMAEARRFAASFEKARAAHREERARRLVEHAKAKVARMLARNVLVVRIVAVRLGRVGVLGEDEILDLYAEGRARQAQDDRKTGRGRT